MGDDEIDRNSEVIICSCHCYSLHAIVMSRSKRNATPCFYSSVIYGFAQFRLVLKQSLINFSSDVQLMKFAFRFCLSPLHSGITAGDVLLLFTPDKRLLLLWPAYIFTGREVQFFSEHFIYLSSLECLLLDCFSSGETRWRTSIVVCSKCVLPLVYMCIFNWQWNSWHLKKTLGWGGTKSWRTRNLTCVNVHWGFHSTGEKIETHTQTSDLCGAWRVCNVPEINKQKCFHLFDSLNHDTLLLSLLLQCFNVTRLEN